ncbi:MAG: glycoside hydrolase family 3 C-terminal domain-containing protein [Pseudomonadales bacterium]
MRKEMDAKRIESMIEGLSLDQKITLVSGASLWRTQPIVEQGIPVLKMSDGPNGVRGDGGSSAASFPVGICMGATWNKALIEATGVAIAEEAKSKDVQVVLGPTINLHRTPLGGRNFECYSEDPVLSGELAAAFTTGVQSQGVGACLKHFVCNDSEFERHTISVELDQRTLREVYLKPFQIAIEKSQPWTLMAAYNRINGIYACSHHELLNEILKGEWGFEGLVISDWFAAKETIANALGGLDLEMPGPSKVWGADLRSAVDAGDVPEAVIDDKVRRLLRVLAWSGRFDHPEEKPESSIDVEIHRSVAYQTASEGMVLLKNQGVLPFQSDNIRKLAVIGPNVKQFRIMGGGSSSLKPHYISAPLDALSDKFPNMDIAWQTGCPTYKYIPGPDSALLSPALGNDPKMAPGLRVKFFRDIALQDVIRERVIGQSTVHASLLAGSAKAMTLEGFYHCPSSGRYTFGLLSTGRCRMSVNGQEIIDNWTSPEPGDAFFMQGTSEVRAELLLEAGENIFLEMVFEANPEAMFKGLRYGILEPQFDDPISEAVTLAAAADACLLMVGTNDDWETEGNDRDSLDLPGDQDLLIERVLAVNPNTVVINNSGAPIAMPWEPVAPAILQCWFAGQELGRALVDVLFGDVNPSGRLPLSFPREIEDMPAAGHYPGSDGQVTYGEGLEIGYRGYAARNQAPLFAFGHGLSYTTFGYANLVISKLGEEGGAQLAVDVTNTGTVVGQDVVQVYAKYLNSPVDRPALTLVGFEKVVLMPGETTRVLCDIAADRFSYWDVATKKFKAESGACELFIGASAAELTVSGTIDFAPI